MTPRLIEVRQKVLKQNDLLARQLRSSFRDAGVWVTSFVSSPGAGKTTLLEKLLTQLHQQMRVAALVGDLATIWMPRWSAKHSATGVWTKSIYC